MDRLFTVSWPRAARFETALLLPVAVAALGASGPLRAMVVALAAMAFPQAPEAGMVRLGTQWLALACITAIPYVLVLMAVDRLLAVRKGFAILSLLAAATWAAAAAFFTAHEASFGHGDFQIPGAALPPTVAASLGAGALALLLHARPLITGLRDRGFVGTRLAARRDEANTWRKPGSGSGQGAGTAWVAPNPRARRARARTIILRRALPWGIVVAVAYNLYAFRSPIAALGRLIASEIAPRSVAAAGPNEAVALRGADGHFAFDAEANGVNLRMIYDPEATFVTLRAADARLLGAVPRSLDYSAETRTANGFIDVAPITLDTLRVGNITLRNVPANVARAGQLDQNILGQSFLRRLASSAVVMDRLLLKGS